MERHKISRRAFLGQASCAAIGATTMFSTLLNLKTLNAAAAFNSSILAGPEDYKALVCIMFSGGIDSFNMLVPRSGAAYSEYALSRSNLALNRNELRPIYPINQDSEGREFGFHPSMVNMQALFNSGNLGFVSNVGTLVRPMNKIEYYDGLVSAPLGLYSHSDQQQQWQTGVPNERSSIGWGGKIADLMISANNNDTISMNISVAGSNIFQSGENTVEYSIDPYNGSVGINGYHDDGWFYDRLRRKAIDDMVSSSQEDIFKSTYLKTIKKGIDGNEMLADVLDNAPEFSDPFTSDHYFSRSLEMVAKTIAGRDKLDVKRQIFFVEIGGWDMHDELIANQEALLSIVDTALGKFYNALVQLGVHDKVTTFSLSEFSRTLSSNGNGTDHAWGANVFVMGNAVKGQNIYGRFPSLALTNYNLNSDTNPLDVGGGVLLPSVSTDEYFAELALWYGVPASELVLLFPNIGNFYNPMSGNMPVGFMEV
ncbi:MAG: DUF1501 domain-containing protein [Chitinophagales bacterium]|nr:DUF1501 domain-containing protein [Chitinophagales bacterium]